MGRTQGEQLQSLCAKAEHEVLLVAPFIKLRAFEQILQVISNDVRLMCITRWRPEEVAGGISDVDIWPVIRDRRNSKLWLRPNLHAKYYRSDNRCLVGSANVTLAALGWTHRTNLELLVELSADNEQLSDFESQLIAGAVLADDDLYIQLKEIALKINQERQPIYINSENSPPDSSELAVSYEEDESWIPTLRSPELLHKAYSGRLEELTVASREAAIKDLAMLPVSEGMDRTIFEACIGALLLQKPIVNQVDDYLSIPRRFGAVRNLLESLPCAQAPDFEANRAWQTLMRWLRYYLPVRYGLSVPSHSEIFYRVKD